MKQPEWFKQRHYGHFDSPVSSTFAGKISEAVVSAHKWSPLIKYTKNEKRYKRVDSKTVIKARPIMYASHRDACILSKYSYHLCELLENQYQKLGISESVAAYRSLGKSNYHFAKETQNFVRGKDQVAIICLDVHGFFDHLNHSFLKSSLASILDTEGLDDDWFKVFRAVTKYRFVLLEDLKAHDHLKSRLRNRIHPIVTIKGLNALGINIDKNPNAFGIPQGTPISASLSNLYMLGFDAAIHAKVLEIGGFYRRYSDDILLACHPDKMQELEQAALDVMQSIHLEIQSAKTERVILSGTSKLDFQYLGFLLGRGDATLRHKSLSKQWRSIRRGIKRARREGEKSIALGKSDRIYRKKVCVRFTDAGRRNFLSYARRSAEELESPSIRRQIKRLRKFAQKEIAALKP